MIAYIWINPVVDRMYEPETLNTFLARHGHKRLYTSGDWLGIVKEKYRLAATQSDKPVMDVRCPKVKDLLEELDVLPNVIIPEIKPILIHCGEEGSGQEVLQEEEKIITTPCQSLADMGNALELESTRFVPWNDFVEMLGDEPQRTIPKKSPIPPGFFAELGIKTDSVTGEEKLREYFKKGIPEGVQLVEMLYCKEGCHNGDGIKDTNHER